MIVIISLALLEFPDLILLIHMIFIMASHKIIYTSNIKNIYLQREREREKEREREREREREIKRKRKSRKFRKIFFYI